MKKINVAEILRNCPRDMELYSPLCGDCKLYSVNDYNITIKIPNKDSLIILRRDGTYCANGEIMIFPKGKTTWEGFVPPRKFKTGDIIFTTCASGNTWISIFKKKGAFGEVETYVDYNTRNNNLNDCYINTYGASLCTKKDIAAQRLATEEEKAKLLKAIEDKGYRWNTETKTLEKLIVPKFKVGDVIQDIDSYRVKITDVCVEDEMYGYESVIAKGIGGIGFDKQDEWELVHNKFDINTLVPFESRVLVREDNTEKWKSNFWGFYDIDSAMCYPYECCGSSYAQCIPYEGNEHLLGRTDDCDNFYKTWK